MLTLTIIDIKHQILPDHITIPGIWVGLICNAFQLFTTPKYAILGASIGYVSLWIIAYTFKLWRKTTGMGHGDFKLFALLGAWLGLQALPTILLYASITGSIGGILFCYIKHKEIDQPFPFGPYLAMAGWYVAIFQTIL